MTWRKTIAEKIGINLKAMEGYCENGIPWDEVPSRGLNKLLHHSDCDGEISPEDGIEIAEDLESILEELKTEEGDYWHPHGWVYDSAVKFINGLRDAYSKNENVEFH